MEVATTIIQVLQNVELVVASGLNELKCLIVYGST